MTIVLVLFAGLAFTSGLILAIKLADKEGL